MKKGYIKYLHAPIRIEDLNNVVRCICLGCQANATVKSDHPTQSKWMWRLENPTVSRKPLHLKALVYTVELRVAAQFKDHLL